MDVFTYIDNSNIHIGGINNYGVEARFSYRNFQNKYCKDGNYRRKVIVGSKFKNDEHFNDSLSKLGYEVFLYDRGLSGEKRIDTTLVLEATKDISIHVGPAKMILFTGDQDMLPIVEEALANYWKVELWAYRDSVSVQFQKIESEDFEIRFIEDYAEDLIYFSISEEQRTKTFKEYLERELLRTEKYIQEEQRLELHRIESQKLIQIQKQAKIQKIAEECTRQKKRNFITVLGTGLSAVVASSLFLLSRVK